MLKTVTSLLFKSRKKIVLTNPQIWRNLPRFKCSKQLLLCLFDINDDLDREHVLRKLSVSGQVPETIDLLCAKALENLIFSSPSPKV